MASPLGLDRLLPALRAEGVRYYEYKNWRKHNRNHKGPWGPVNGVMIHHTVSSGDDSSVALCYNGHSTLPGPLCHAVGRNDGKVALVGHGRANHAGLGDDDVLRAVIAEKPLPADNEANTDGNRHFYGFECENLGDGEDPWPAAQLEAIERAAAAVCRHHGWNERSVIGHAEWQPGKVDPRGFSMGDMRGRIGERLGGTTPAPPLPTPKRPVVDLSQLRAAARSNPPAEGQPVTYTGVRTVEAALVDEGLLAKQYSDGHYGTTTVAAYSAWQRHLGYRGNDADGIPGKTSLTRLGRRHGFDVKD